MLLARHGMVSFASSFDTPGVLARSVRDAALVANHMSGVDGVDSTCVMEATTFLPEPGGRLDNVRVGIPQEYHIAELSDGALAAWHQGVEWIEQQGGTAVPQPIEKSIFDLTKRQYDRIIDDDAAVVT